MIKQSLVNLMIRSSFHPDWAGAFVNPFYIARRGLNEAMRDHAPLLRGRLLDVGCGTKPYRTFFDVDEYIGLDIDSAVTRRQGTADYLYDGKRFPFEEGEFDSILCSQVLEHVFNPPGFLAEVHRVLKPGGRIVLTVPFVWDEHEQPWDYARYSSFGLRALFEKNGFSVERQTKVNANIAVIFQLFNVYLYKVLPLSPRLRLVVGAFVMGPVSILGEWLGRVLPQNDDLYLDQIIVATKDR